MTSETLLELWEAQSRDGLAAAGWSRALAGLSPEQASWRVPNVGGERHSIWQIVHHVVFWLEVGLAQSRGETGPTPEEIARRNFESPVEVSDAAWAAAVERLQAARGAVAAAIREPAKNADVWPYLLAHDNYHLGQIMLLRAMQGMPVVE